ncbi:MAG: hypothetical protein ACYTFI_24395 [Planctomycetota bacterium]|jgi:hypothetical protein
MEQKARTAALIEHQSHAPGSAAPRPDGPKRSSERKERSLFDRRTRLEHPVLFWIGVPLAVWFGGCAVAFICSFAMTVLGAPRWLPLPWSDFRDFVEGTDGRVYVNIAMFSRVLCYDDSGHFVASYPEAPYAKDAGLAAGANGRIYLRGSNTVSVMTPEWELVQKVDAHYRADRTWRMGPDGAPIHSPGIDPNTSAPNRAVRPGELLFSDNSRVRREFVCRDGSLLRRRRNSLRKVAPDGSVVAEYGGHWLYTPVTFPLPGMPVWFAFLAYGFVWHAMTRPKRSPASVNEAGGAPAAPKAGAGKGPPPKPQCRECGAEIVREPGSATKRAVCEKCRPGYYRRRLRTILAGWLRGTRPPRRR